MLTLLFIILANLIISAISLLGILVVILRKKDLATAEIFLVAFSAGALMAGAFLDILPEASLELSGNVIFPLVLISFVGFFLIEKVFHFRHCHRGKCDVHVFGYLNLLGDSMHNFLDGIIIAGAFLVDFKLGFITSLAVVFHEIPQEIGDFGVLTYSGFSKRKALSLNLLVGLLAVLGGIVGYFLSIKIDNMAVYLLPIAAGSFIYIATSDLIPEIKKEIDLKKSGLLFLWFLLGIVLIYLGGKLF